MEQILWKINRVDKEDIVTFYNEKGEVVSQETLENVIGDYVDQREDEWIGEGE